MELLSFLKHYLWSIIIIFVATAITSLIVLRLLRFFIHASNEWLKAASHSAYVPIQWMIWGGGAFILLETVWDDKHFIFSKEHLSQGRHLFLLAFITWLLFRCKNQFVQILISRANQKSNQSDKALVYALSKLISAFFFVIAAFIALSILGVPMGALLTFGGVGGAAIAFSSQGVISNFFGGLMLYIHRPFSVGDWIRSMNKNFEGVVEDIGWYMTRVRSLDRRPTYIPNALMTDAIIENPGRMYHRRIKTPVGVRYEDIDKIPLLTQKIEAMLKAHPSVDQKQMILVHFSEFGEYSLDILVYCFTKATRFADFQPVKQDIFLKIAHIVEECGAQIAFPTKIVKLDREPSDSGKS